jgi:hypothetical protein
MSNLAGIRPVLVCLFAVGLALAACDSKRAQPTDQNVLSQAANEATAIIQQAQATALVLQAQARATEMMGQVSIQNTSPATTLVIPVPTQVQDPSPGSPMPEASLKATMVQEVQILGVSFAAEGGFIMVRFLAPPEEAAKWWQGDVSVMDEASGEVYNEIPVMPKVGPIIGRPKRSGQIGYVMLHNTAPQLKSGAIVTVKLGNYVFEHVSVE